MSLVGICLVLFWCCSLPMSQFIFMKSTGFNLKSEKDPFAYNSGPPIKLGGYDTWNWCKRCKHIYTKDIKYCSDCKGMQLRTTSKAKFGDNSRNLSKVEKRKRAIAVQADLIAWQRESFK